MRPLRLRNLDMMTLTGLVVMSISISIPGFLSVRETRISAGLPVNLLDVSPVGFLFFVLLGTAIFSLSLTRHSFYTGLLGGLVPVAGFFVTGLRATAIAAEVGPFSRVSPAAGLWLLVFSGYVLVFGARKKLKDRRELAALLVLVPISLTLLMLVLGHLNGLSIMKEFANRRTRFFEETARHLIIAGGAVFFGSLIGIPLGILAKRSNRVEKPVFAFVNFMQTIPSVALFGLLIAPLSYLSRSIPFLRQLGISGIGWTPAMIALVLYSLLPITRNTYASLKTIPHDTIEAGIGMGMSRLQILSKIEIPMALPVVLAGVRTAAIQAVGNTTMAALIGAGGLGVFVFQGLGQAAMDLVLLGALPIVALALIVDSFMQLLIALLTPRGLVMEEGK